MMILAVWRSYKNQGIRRFKIEDLTCLSTPNSGRGTVKVIYTYPT